MKKFHKGKFLYNRVFIPTVCFMYCVFNTYGQNYPDQVQLPNVNYQVYQEPNTSFPDYLDPFTENMSGSTIMRITDSNIFGVTNQRLRHNYSKDQTWNSDETRIKMAGYPAAILDAETYELLYWSNIPSYGRWSNTQPNIVYGTSGNTFVSHDINTNQRTTLITFSEYSSVDFGFGEGNQDKFDRYVGIIGRRGGNNITLIVYDIQNNVIVGTRDIDNAGDLDWFSVSQLGGHAVAQWHANGTGEKLGIRAYNIDLTNEHHVYHNSQHGDLGVDSFGNEVIVEYGNQSEWDSDHSLYMARLDGGGSTMLFPYINGRGIWGGHISCRNLDRPGWAYISEQCCSDNPVAPREIFAIKLDGSGTIERFAKHHAAPSTYLHETQLVPNRNGTKIIFASNWSDSSVMNENAPPAFVLEYPQSSQGITVTAGNDIQICEGQSTNLTAYGIGASNFSWSTGENTQNIEVSPSTTTTYTVTLSDDSGNSVSDEVIVTVNPLPVANAGNGVTINEGESTTLNASGGTDYEWNTGSINSSITVSPSETTTYTVEVSQNGCTSEASVTVTVIPTPIEADAGNDVTICENDSTVLNASGGSDYVWSTGETSQSITVNPSTTTTYTVTVSEGNVSDTDSVEVIVNSLPEANAGNDVTINEGESTTLNASGGTDYEWNTGSINSSITVNPSETTTYTVEVSQNGCISEASVIVTVIPSPTVVANAGDDVSICENGSTVLTASGGTDYEWSTGETTESITVNPSTTTTYTVTVSEGNVSDTDSVEVTVNPLPEANAGNDVTINEGESTTLSASGGTDYEWNTGSTNSSITVSPSETTTYTVEVSQNGCTSEASVTVTVIPSPTVVANAGDDVSICENGSTVLTASGGTDYEWSTGETTASITVNPSSTTTYTVTVSEGNVSDTDSVEVTINPLPEANAGTDVTINEGESTTLSASGGTDYEWNTGSTNSSITVSPSETTTYTVEVSQNGCTSEANVTVTVIPSPTVVANAGDDVSICENGSAVLTASGGTSYEWSTGETTASITVNPSITTTYTVTVSEENVSDTDSITVTVNPLPEANAGNDVTINEGESTTLSASGGTDYEWNTGSTNSSITVNPSETTTYTVEVSQNGCTSEASVTLTVIPSPIVVANAGDDVSICENSTTVLTASGGTDYEWSTGETTASITVNPSTTTTYTVTVSEGNVSDTDSVAVTVNPLPEANAGNDELIEAGDNVTLFASGGNTYLWNTGSTDSSITVNPSETNTYSVTVFTNGCSTTDDVMVTVVQPVDAYAGEDVEICLGETVMLTATGGTSYEWSTGEISQSIEVTPTRQNTVFHVTVSNGISSANDTVRVTTTDCQDLNGETENVLTTSITVYPNPAQSNVHIKLPKFDNRSVLRVFDLMGRTLINQNIQAKNQSTINLNVSDLPRGIYIVTVTHKEKSYSKRLILSD